jgi:hypothetical protein
MKHASRARILGTIVFGCAIAGCSSTQPDSVTSRTGSISFSANGTVPIYNCYDVWQDTSSPPDGIPDVFINSVCEEQFGPGVPPVQIREARPIPWRYSIKITKIPAGSTTEQLVIATDGVTVGSSVEPDDFAEDFESLTNYDPAQSPVPNRIVGDVYFINGKRVSAGSTVYLSTAGFDLGVPNTLTFPTTFDFNVTTGDTIIVRARKQLVVDAPPYLPPSPDPEIKITASLAVSGVVVTPQGTPADSPGSSTIEDGGGTTFSFTVR